MSQQFQALPIDDQHAAAAYPLVYLHDPSITTDQWLHIVRRQWAAIPGQSGLIAVHDCRNIVHALFSYRVDSDLHLRRRLCITDLIVAHLPGSEIDDAIAATARNVSARLECEAITIERPFTPAIRRPSCPTVEQLKRRSHLFGRRQ